MFAWILDAIAAAARRAQAMRAAEKAQWLKQFKERLRGVPR